MRKLIASGSPGRDEISPIFLKKNLPYLVEPLKKMLQLSLSQGHLPRDWKNGTICPIYKNNNQPNGCNSYRTICLTSVVCKILEHIVHDQIISYLMHYNLVTPAQHGFLSKRPTTTNLLSCLNEWTKFVDKNLSVDVVYIDMAEAFDTVSQPRLLHKLRLLGSGIND